MATKEAKSGKSKAQRKLDELGFTIIAKGGQITRVNDKLFLVKSQSNALAGKVAHKVKWAKEKWTCQCSAYESGKNRLCEHIHAVNILLKLPQIILANLEAIEGACPDCGSNDIIMKGFRFNKNGYVRRFLCKNCGIKFKNPLGHENVNSNISLSIIVFDLYFKKLSLAEIKGHLWQVYGIEKATSTIYDWITRFRQLVRQATKDIKFKPGKKWLADEMVIKVNGRKQYLWNILDFDSRYHLVSILTRGRGTREASMVIKRAIEKTGDAPKEVVTDGLQSYCAPLSERGITHIGNVGLAKYQNNNRIERLHGTVRSFVRAKRGMRSRAAQTLETHRLYYNLIRPHSSLGKRTPSRTQNPRWTSILGSSKRKINSKQE